MLILEVKLMNIAAGKNSFRYRKIRKTSRETLMWRNKTFTGALFLLPERTYLTKERETV